WRCGGSAAYGAGWSGRRDPRGSWRCILARARTGPCDKRKVRARERSRRRPHGSRTSRRRADVPDAPVILKRTGRSDVVPEAAVQLRKKCDGGHTTLPWAKSRTTLSTYARTVAWLLLTPLCLRPSSEPPITQPATPRRRT